jgi:NADPH2:quinone reductase
MSSEPSSLGWQATGFGDPQKILTLVELSTPRPGPAEILVRVAANGLNFLDVSICCGEHPVRPTPPFVPGAELVGVVIEVGSGGTSKVGDRVVAINPSAYGCFREEAVVPDFAALPIPEDIPDVHAAALFVTYQTAFVALQRRAALKLGEWALVHAGAGALGTALIQVANALGAKVIATAGSPVKLQVCLDQGATAAINYKENDFPNTVLELTEGRGADVVCDTVGGDVFLRSLECTAFEGRILPLGWVSRRMPKLAAGRLVARNISVIGVSWGSTYPRVAPEVVRGIHDELIRLYRSGAIEPFVPRVFPATALPTMLQELAAGTSLGKSVLLWSSAEG